MPKSKPYEGGLHKRLKDFEYAVQYIKAAAEDSIEGFLLALRDVAEARMGMSKVAEAADKNRENLYRMLSEDGNPRLNSLWAVVNAMGLQITVESLSGSQDEVIFHGDAATGEIGNIPKGEDMKHQFGQSIGTVQYLNTVDNGAFSLLNGASLRSAIPALTGTIEQFIPEERHVGNR